jgi:hypothetical protein
VYSGCHVFLEPISYAVNFHYDDVVVPVYVKASDFVAVGTFANTIPSAVFMKYVLRKQDHDNALKHKCIIS